MRATFAIGLMACCATAAQAQTASGSATFGDPIRMSAAQIAAHNAALDSASPTYIKCVKTEPVGSLVKRRVCRTNEDWERQASSASQDARDIVDRLNTSGSSNSQEPAGSIVPMPR